MIECHVQLFEWRRESIPVCTFFAKYHLTDTTASLRSNLQTQTQHFQRCHETNPPTRRLLLDPAPRTTVHLQPSAMALIRGSGAVPLWTSTSVSTMCQSVSKAQRRWPSLPLVSVKPAKANTVTLALPSSSSPFAFTTAAPPKDPAMIDQRPDPAQGDAQRRRRYSRKQRFQEPSAGTRRSARTAGASSSSRRTHSQRDDADEEHTSDQPDGMVGKVMKMLKK